MKKICELPKYVYTLKLKIKGILKPIIIILEDERHINTFFEKLNDSSDFISFGQIAFAKSEFKYLIYKCKKVK